MDRRITTPYVEVLAKLELARKTICAIASGSERFTMSIPARPDRDTDIIVCDAVESARKLIESFAPSADVSIIKHGDTSPCIDREEQELCEWAYDGGDPDTGVSGCWTCKTCGCVDINREPPSDY